MVFLLSLAGVIAIFYFGIGLHENIECSVTEEDRIWLNESFYWLIESFGVEKLASMKVMTPTPKDFPIKADGSRESVTEVLKIVAKQMDVAVDKIDLHFFKSKKKEDGSSNPGFYQELENGRFRISIAEDITENPLSTVAIIAHELAHAKLLGERRIDENDEHLTDLTTIFWGFGIINGNAAFQIAQSFDAYERTASYQYSTLGYLHERQYAYGLALFSYYRNESNPDWQKYLSPNMKKYYKINLAFIHKNEANMFEQ